MTPGHLTQVHHDGLLLSFSLGTIFLSLKKGGCDHWIGKGLEGILAEEGVARCLEGEVKKGAQMRP